MDQRQRQRRFHRRSRNGCLTCKTKHIRCDEKKPLCTFCLRHGGRCQYPADDQMSGTEPDGSGASGEPHGPSVSRDGAAARIGVFPADIFAGTQYELPSKSRHLFHQFASTRVLYRSRVERSDDSFMVRRALSHPAFLNAALLLTTLHWAWQTGDVEQFRVPYLFHKVQAIRFVNEQLQNPETAASDATIALVSSLAIMENSLGSTEAVSSHLQGLARIKELQREEKRPQTMGLLQRMILMAAKSVSRRPVWDIQGIIQTDDVHQSIIIAFIRVALRPIYNIQTLSGAHNHPGEPLSGVLARRKPIPLTNDVSNPSSPRTVDCSRSEFIACYLYLYIILRENTIDSFILEWFMEQLITDVCRTEKLMQKGQYSQALWFWTVIFGACAASSARVESASEDAQTRAMKEVYLEKISLSSQLLKIKNWEGAKAALRLFAWEEDFDGEAEVKAIWEQAVWKDQRKRAKS